MNKKNIIKEINKEINKIIKSKKNLLKLIDEHNQQKKQKQIIIIFTSQIEELELLKQYIQNGKTIY